MSDDGGIGKHDDKLHACIRELEAELADVRTYGAAAKYKARAEASRCNGRRTFPSRGPRSASRSDAT